MLSYRWEMSDPGRPPSTRAQAVLLLVLLCGCIPDDSVEEIPQFDPRVVAGVYSVALEAPATQGLTCRQLTVSFGTEVISWSGCLRAGEGRFTERSDTLVLADSTAAELYRFTELTGPADAFSGRFAGPVGALGGADGGSCAGTSAWSRELPNARR
jgi:hypothetical protein